MPKFFRGKRRDAHKPMNTGLVFKHTIRIPPRSFKHNIPITPVAILVFVKEGYLETLISGIFIIHSKEHSRKIFRVVSSGAGKNSDNRVPFIVFPFPEKSFFELFMLFFF